MQEKSIEWVNPGKGNESIGTVYSNKKKLLKADVAFTS